MHRFFSNKKTILTITRVDARLINFFAPHLAPLSHACAAHDPSRAKENQKSVMKYEINWWIQSWFQSPQDHTGRRWREEWVHNTHYGQYGNAPFLIIRNLLHESTQGSQQILLTSLLLELGSGSWHLSNQDHSMVSPFLCVMLMRVSLS